MYKWKPITASEFAELFERQYTELGVIERENFDKFRVSFWLATIKRSHSPKDEMVFVVAQKEDGVLYYDDVEYGFNISFIDSTGRILTPGGSQNTLKEAVHQWI
jgi:hypothetical protein